MKVRRENIFNEVCRSGNGNPGSGTEHFHGGHGMIFRDKQNQLKFVLHTPNALPNGNPVDSRAKIFDLGDGGANIYLTGGQE